MADVRTQSPPPGHEATTSGAHRFPPTASLRNRQLARAATFSEAGPSMSNTMPMRRRSSLLSNLSLDDSRYSLRSSTDSVLRPADDTMEKLKLDDSAEFHWHTLPLSFVLFPAIAGLIWSNGSTIASDLMLLCLGCLFLYWCTRLPWDWYKAAQTLPPPDHSETEIQINPTITEEESEEEQNDEGAQSPKSTERSEPKVEVKPQTPEQEAAFYGLRRTETIALIGCFVGPLLGAYFLHAIRTLLSPPSESLLNDVNLSVFVIVAEARPFALICRLEKSRINRLQSVAYPDGNGLARSKEELRDVCLRMDVIETRLAEMLGEREGKDMNSEISASVRQGLQPQLDALNRAVRRYEKRSVVQTMQTEARLNDLETRLQDALSLAAAAARNGQKPGLFLQLFEWLSGLIMFWLQSVWTVVLYPFQLTSHCVSVMKCWVSGPSQKQPSKRKGKTKSPR